MAVLNPETRYISQDTRFKGFELIELLDVELHRPQLKDGQIAKIQSVMRTQYAFKEDPFQGEELGRELMALPLMVSTRKKIFQRVNARQVFALQRSSPEMFPAFCYGMFDHDQLNYLRFFEQARFMNGATIKKSFIMLEHIIKKDASLFDEMVRFLDRTFPESPEIDAIVLEAGRRIDSNFDEQQLLEIKKRRFDVQRKVVTLTAGDVGRIENVSLARLQDHRYFATHLEARWKRSDTIPLSVEEWVTKNDLEWFFYHIQTMTPIPLEKILTVLVLANTFGITDCVKACYQTMMQNQEMFKNKLGTVGFLQFLFDHAHFEGSHALHKAELKKECLSCLRIREIETFRELIQMAVHEHCMDEILIISNSQGRADDVRVCYNTIMQHREAYVLKLGVAGFLRFLFEHAHFYGSHTLHKQELKKEFRKCLQRGQPLIVEVVEIAEQQHCVDEITSVIGEMLE